MFIVRSSPKPEEVRQRTRTSVETKAIEHVRFIRTARLFNDGLNFTASISLFAKCCLKFHHVLSVPYFPRKHALHALEVSSLLFHSLFFHFHRFMFEIGIQVERYMNSGSFFCRVPRWGQGNYWQARFRLSLSNLLGEGWGSVLPQENAFRLHFHFRRIVKWGGGGIEKSPAVC